MSRRATTPRTTPAGRDDDPRASGFLAALANVNTWKRGGQRAPHKPLLLLLALGRVQRGESREVDFPTIEPRLHGLLEEFGPARTSYHPEYPFWRLQSDGLWVVRDASSFGHRKGNTDPPVSELRDAPALGGLPEEWDALLRERPELIVRAARQILDEHFESSLHGDILAAAGLDAAERESASRRVRDPDFPVLVLRAYEYRCAACGFDMQIDGRSAGLEAAHVRWHSHGGPSTVENGVCFCSVHHKAFDLGAIGLTDDLRLVVSQRVHGGDATRSSILDLHDHPLRGPQSRADRPRAAFVKWHHDEVFKQPARAG